MSSCDKKLFLVPYLPYFEHVKAGWNSQSNKNVLFLFYENLKKDLEGSLKNLANFLNKPLDDQDLPQLLDHLRIENCRKNDALNGKDLIDLKIFSPTAESFIREGNSRAHSEKVKPNLSDWIEENIENLPFEYPL